MLRDTDGGAYTATDTARILAFDRARTFITLMVVVHHSVVNYTYFGNGDRMRWLGFDLMVLFNDSYFMAFMFLISGLFVHESLTRRGALGYLRRRAFRLGVPLLISIFVFIPIAYYASFLRYHMPGTTDFNFFHYWWRMITVGPWPSGQSWFLWVLLAFDIVAVAVWSMAPKILTAWGRLIETLRERPIAAFVAFLIVSIASYLPMHLAVGDGAWFEPGHYPFPIQTSRIFLYPAYFLTGVGIGMLSLRTGILAENSEIARRWPIWLAFAVLLYGTILLLVYAHHNWLENFSDPALWWRAAYGLAFASFSAAMAFTIPATSLRLAHSSLRFLDAMQPSAYGIFLVHYMFIIWLQYVVYDPAWPAVVKSAIVFVGTLGGSWLLTIALRKIPFVVRMI
ncbi:acyltransferase [Bradyrhizobium lablabi]|uniref:acyltransferase family protein n=1 Tax=Bradyrhizobium lablabi TaxID=722472 RepID=UPI001BA89B3F|nr:acyltransferase [Bradyrhizobium lablabi]MBR1121279.1 acyltransferase [Bradyrhizobium lablabi]